MAWSLGQRCLAEFLGTFGLLVAVTGAAIFSLNLATYDQAARVILIAFALGLGVLGMAYAFGDISGASFNPAITIGAWAAGRNYGDGRARMTGAAKEPCERHGERDDVPLGGGVMG